MSCEVAVLQLAVKDGWADECLKAMDMRLMARLQGMIVAMKQGTGVYSKQNDEEMKSVIERMLGDCVERCTKSDMMNICIEAESWEGIEMDRWAPQGLIRVNKCAARVNVVAACLVELCVGANVSFWKEEGLPKGLGRILALEGIPHFVVGPGVDSI
nr:uncharacterized protein LOC109149028 [Ipomoea trifida]